MMNIDQPWDELVETDGYGAIVRTELNTYGSLLNNLVSIGSHLMKWEMANQLDVADVDAINQRTVVFTLFRRLLEHLDGCATLFRKGNLVSCGVLTRAIIELSYELDFLFLNRWNREEFDIKVRCYLMMDYESELAALAKFYPLNEFKRNRSQMDGQMKQLQGRLDDPYFKVIEDRYKRAVFQAEPNGTLTTNKKESTPKWYTVYTWNWGKDKRLKEMYKLADYIDEEQRKKSAKAKRRYLIFSVMSSFVHSSAMTSSTVRYDEETQTLLYYPIRYPLGYQDTIHGLMHLLRPVFDLMATRRTRSQQTEYGQAMTDLDRRYHDALLKTKAALKGGGSVE